MNTNQSAVAVAMEVAGSPAVAGPKRTNVAKSAKKPGKAHPTESQMVAFCVAAFSDYMHADASLQNVKALYDAARMGLRTELARAHKVIGKGKVWDAFKATLRAALVKAQVSETPKDAGRLINNALIALGLTGNGAKKGGKRKGAGRPESDGKPVAAVLSEKHVVAANLAAVAYVAKWQSEEIDSGTMERLGELLAILTAKA
jgi:hypothetical protein